MTKQAAILGGGVIGGGWAARFLLMGWDVIVYDPASDAKTKLEDVLKNARRSLPALSENALPNEGNLTWASSVEEAVSSAEWIQESVPERLDIKHAVLQQVQAACREDAIIGSSTSGFKPSELQQGSIRPAQIIVAHPFNPVYLLPLVELVGEAKSIKQAQVVLQSLGMYGLHVRKEIDAHIADRFLEAVWREGLWLIKDGIATTQEIDDAIRFGFGLRWAQMGLFETYRIAGGEAGMAHFIEQFGPALKWPWTKLMDVPDLTPELIDQIAEQSDAQSGIHSIRELERIRDDNLVGMMRALKARGWGAGKLLNDYDQQNPLPLKADGAALINTINRVIPIDWTDYNGHMNESRYGQVFSDAADSVLRMIGADQAYVDSGRSYFTVDIHIKFIEETLAHESIEVYSQILQGEGKKLRLFHKMMAKDGRLLATGEQMLLHVDLGTRKSSIPEDAVLQQLTTLAKLHADLPHPES